MLFLGHITGEKHAVPGVRSTDVVSSDVNLYSCGRGGKRSVIGSYPSDIMIVSNIHCKSLREAVAGRPRYAHSRLISVSVISSRVLLIFLYNL